MIPLTLQAVRAAVRATHAHLPDRTVERVSTDTRTLVEGDLFVALRGDRFDAHDHLDQASRAAAAVVERVPDSAPADLPMIVVPDARRALGDLARHHRQALRHTKVIAVAGSNGKTTTKGLIHAALAGSLRGTASPASFNNDVGVPLTLLPVSPRDDYVIVECGTNHPGEIARLSDIARPDIAVITSIGEEHLEGLGDLEGVRHENAAITAGMGDKAMLVLPDEADLVRHLAGFSGRRLTIGLGEACDLFAADVHGDLAGVRFRLNAGPCEFEIPIAGIHTVTNALAAIAVAKRFGLSDQAIAAGLAGARSPAMRMERSEREGVVFVNDAYNANPASMRAALRTLAEAEVPDRRIAVLGEMLELGEQSDAYHRDLGRHAAEAGLDRLLCVGHRATVTAEAAVAAGMASKVVDVCDTVQAAADRLASLTRPGDTVLLKASRGLRLEQILELTPDQARPAA
jgi:UDP-N-acetylmuramoyl-tripeptide--D-alanyl-D-alanine ligase